MYFPSMLFGGSSLLHLLASHPRIVVMFGLTALMASWLQTPFGPRDLPGTAAYVRHLDAVVRASEAVDPGVIEQARRSARALQESAPGRVAEVVDETLARCGSGCVGLDTATVLRDATLTEQVLFVHALNREHGRTRAQSGAPAEIVAPSKH